MRHPISTLILSLSVVLGISACSKDSKPDPFICVLPDPCIGAKYIGTTGWDLFQLSNPMVGYTGTYTLPDGRTFENVFGVEKGWLPEGTKEGQNVYFWPERFDSSYVYQTIWTPVKSLLVVRGSSLKGCPQPTGKPEPGSPK
ncbi:hypothetical protein ACWKWU_02230 [Chitinophaga lutea]